MSNSVRRPFGSIPKRLFGLTSKDFAIFSQAELADAVQAIYGQTVVTAPFDANPCVPDECTLYSDATIQMVVRSDACKLFRGDVLDAHSENLNFRQGLNQNLADVVGGGLTPVWRLTSGQCDGLSGDEEFVRLSASSLYRALDYGPRLTIDLEQTGCGWIPRLNDTAVTDHLPTRLSDAVAVLLREVRSHITNRLAVRLARDLRAVDELEIGVQP